MEYLLIGGLLLVAVVFFFTLRSFLVRTPHESVVGSYRLLLNQVSGDRGKAERLIAYEMRKNPYLSRDEAIEDASSRIISDLR